MKFTVITKDGSKWLSRTAPHGVDPIQWHSDNLDLPYIGSSKPGATLDESEVREVRQFKDNGEWVETSYENYMEDDELGLPVRTAYTDAEPPDIDYEKEMPHKKWPSTKYVARPADAESHELSAFDEILNNTSDDAKMNVSLQMDLNYWKRRCEAAEKLIGISPSDPKTYDEFCRLREEWQEIVKQEPK